VHEHKITSGPKKAEVTGGWRKLHNEELRNLYSSRHIHGVMKSGRMRWAGNVAAMGKCEMYTQFRSENLKSCELLCASPHSAFKSSLSSNILCSTSMFNTFNFFTVSI
jgi:hypothetical protein